MPPALLHRWRGVVSIPAGPSLMALRDTAYGLARYAAISQVRPGGRIRLLFWI